MLRRKARYAKVEPPDEECIAHGTHFFCQIDRSGDGRSGKVYDRQNLVTGWYRSRPAPGGFDLHNPFKKRDFVFSSLTEPEETIIRRHSFFPPVFHIMNGGAVAGSIRLISPLRNKYLITLDGLNNWIFQMPVFTASFFGASSQTTDIWVLVGASQMEWRILIRAGIVSRNLMATLAFLHNERWWYG